MLVRRHGGDYNFVGDTASGVTLRWGRTTHDDPARAPWPELADIAISNRCSRGCAVCYRDSAPDGALMSFEQYAFVLERLQSPRWGNVFQVALGGGEPLEHPDFEHIVRHTRSRGVMVNFTTSGAGLDQARARGLGDSVGAAAVSAMSLDRLDGKAVTLLAEAGVRVNIHFVLSAVSLGEATDILLGKRNELLRGVNAVIFLTLKPMGRATREDCLRDGPDLGRFIASIEGNRCSAKIGFDACFVPPLLRHTGVNRECIDTCEGGFFSLFIDETMHAKPCSFASDDRHSLDMERSDMDSIWNDSFAAYRISVSQRACGEQCEASPQCRGLCPYHPGIVPCPGRAFATEARPVVN